MADINTVARLLGMTSKKEARKKAVQALLREELRRVRTEKASIMACYGVRDFGEPWRKVEKDEIDDTTAHDGIVRLDFLEDREKG